MLLWGICRGLVVTMPDSLLDQGGLPGRYINMRRCGGLSIVFFLQMEDPLELLVKRRDYIPGSGFLSSRDIPVVVESDVKIHSFLPSCYYDIMIQATPLNPDLCNPDFRLNRADWKVPVPSYTIIPTCIIRILPNPDINLGSTSVRSKQSSLYM